MIKITLEQLKKLNACEAGINWFIKSKLTDLKTITRKLLEDNKSNYAIWLLSRLLTHSQQVQWAIFSAHQVLSVFEKKYPNDNGPRKAIEAAIAWLENPAEENRSIAGADAIAAAFPATYAVDTEMNQNIINYTLKLLGEIK